MAVASRRVSLELEEAVATTLLDLRHSMLRGFLWAAGLAHVGWYYWIAANDYAFYFHTVILLALVPVLYAVVRWQRMRYSLAATLLLAVIALFEGLVLFRYPTSTALCLGVVGVVAAHALLGARPALLMAILTWSGSTLVWRLSGTELPLLRHVGTLGMYLLVWAAGWLSNRPMRASVEWAMGGWAQARQALEEVRGRRAELYQALRALEEATHRIERMNHELILARREAELARTQKARFAATVSHELRGPLSLILGFSRLIARSPQRYGDPLPQAYAADVETIYRNAQHLVALVDDVLDLAQIDADRLPLIKDSVDLDTDVVQKAISIVQPLAERKGLYLRQQTERPLPSVLADPVRLRQALLNLLVNATRFTRRGGIVVRTAQREDHVLVSVEDTGPGIPSEDIPKLFREFAQLQPATGQDPGGSGLGLSISKELVTLHGGRIWVESRLGVGTTVHFTVPLPGASTPEIFVRTTDQFGPEQDGDCCIVVHDDPDVVRLLARYVDRHRVVGLPHEERLAELTTRLHPRAILTTPEMSSRVEEALVAIRAGVPLITCGLPRMRERGRLQGVLGYLIKPVLPEAVAAAMAQVERDGETTVLLVDDEPDAVQLLEEMLTALPRPYRILRAHSGAEALALMATMIPDMVFLDLVMPGVSGEEVITRMREQSRLAEVPVVIISARDWAGAKMALEPPLSLHTPQAIDIGQAARYLSNLLDMLRPDYLGDATSPGSP